MALSTQEVLRKRGKKSRRKGAEFELKVRKYLEDNGWIVARWTNNVELNLIKVNDSVTDFGSTMIPARSNRFNMRTTGFPDFIAYKKTSTGDGLSQYMVTGVECKLQGKLDRNERLKCNWYLSRGIFTSISIASMTDKQLMVRKFEVKGG